VENDVFFYFIVPAALVYSGWATIYWFEKMESGSLTKLRAIYSIIAISAFWIFVLSIYIKYNDKRNFSQKVIEISEALEIIAYLCFLVAGIFIKFDRYATAILLMIGCAMIVYLN